ncbi:Alpha/Beta hydrolase protein [Pelagophyceae sp. CCMP2097]|nr:Alpha/Beta hydrolase protein [Pelagophyceae sp. CCMP2097]
MGFQLSLAGLRPKERAVLLTGTGFVVAGIVVRLARRRRIVAPDVLCGDDDSSLAIAVRAMATMRGFSPHAAMLCGGLVSTAWLGLRMPFSTVRTDDCATSLERHRAGWWRAKRRAGAPIALVLPGMGNSSETGFVRRLLNELDAAGLDATALDYRGCGTAAGLGLLTSLHSAKSWTDVEAVLKHLEVTEPNSTVYIVGHSLGGCLALSVLGRSCPANVGAACIISAPTDFVAGMKRINGTGPGSRLVSFLLTLPTKFMLFSSASLRRQLSKRGVDVRGALWATSLKQVEEA